eukprot:TRINITY_DN39574_c0_g1_i2.p1 TRINITY_DN39574_c0_g1~~TRINITY_DN39574_c0_g1_i2.p1  ORF type:complete len:173 (-),score=33.09 TRINITY_DN39574_c0_g1_i2:267-785(-)
MFSCTVRRTLAAPVLARTAAAASKCMPATATVSSWHSGYRLQPMPPHTGATGLGYRSFTAASTESAPSVKERADALIAEHGCVLFGKTTCGFCSMAINILMKENAKFHVFMMDKELPWNEVDEMQDYMKSLTGGRSVPRVFIGGKFIGGGDDTLELYERGELKGLLEKSGAL